MSEEDVLNNLKELIEEYKLDRMPVTSEVLSFGGHPLHNNVVRKGGYVYFSNKLGLKMKESETRLGQDYEYKVIDLLRDIKLEVEKMSTGHPFDILVDGTVKIDVKVASVSSNIKGNPIHTFGINKKHASCDIYICVALDENKEIERLFIIPSHHLKVVTMCIGKDSKYNKYIDRFDYIEEYSKFFNSII